MKNSSRKKVILCGLAVLAVGTVLLGIGQGGDNVFDKTTSPIAARLNASMIVESAKSVLGVAPKVEVSAPVAAVKVENKAEIEKSYERYRQLSDKTLRSHAENEEYQKLVADPALAQAAAEVITDTSETELSKKTEEGRLKAIDFLTKAIEHPDAGVSQQTASLIAMVLKDETVKPDMSPALKRSKVGDKVELFRLLLNYAPEQAKAVMASATDAKERELYAFAIAVDADVAASQN